MLMILGGLLVFLGGVLALVGTIWMLVIMFKDSVVWGIVGLIGVFFLAFIPQIVYLCMNFGKFAKAFFTWLLGSVIVFVGVMLLGMGMFNFAASPEGQQMLKDATKNDPAAKKALEDFNNQLEKMQKGKK